MFIDFADIFADKRRSYTLSARMPFSPRFATLPPLRRAAATPPAATPFRDAIFRRVFSRYAISLDAPSVDAATLSPSHFTLLTCLLRRCHAPPLRHAAATPLMPLTADAAADACLLHFAMLFTMPPLPLLTHYADYDCRRRFRYFLLLRRLRLLRQRRFLRHYFFSPPLTFLC